MVANESLKSQTEDILVVDDSVENLKLLSDILSNEGYRLRPSEDPRLALESALADPPSLILLDVRMPEMSGFELCRRLKEDGRTQEVPIIFISALQDAEDKVQGFKAGGVDYISKPYQETEILARVKTHLELREKRLHLEELVNERDREIAERVQTDHELRRERDLISRIMDTSPVGISVLDRQGRITFTNALMQQRAALFGEPNVIGLTDKDPSWQLMTMEGKPIADEETPFARVMSTGKSVYDACYAVESQDGQRMVISINTSPLFDESGQISGVVSTTDDITVRELAQEKLRESEERYRDLVEKISDVIYTIDSNGVIIYINPAIETLIGLAPEQVIGQPFNQFIHPVDLENAQNNIQKLLSGGAPGPAEYRVLNSLGEIRWIRVSSQPISEGDQFTGIHGVLTDITDQKALEDRLAEAAALSERDRLAQGLHDSVTQSLYSINLQSDAIGMALSSDNKEKAEKRLGILKEITNEAMTEMRLLIYQLQPSILKEEGLAAAVRRRLDAVEIRSGLSVDFHAAGDERMAIPIETTLYQVAQETLNNILKHAKANEVKVRLTNEQNFCRLTIQDDGVGFDPESNDTYGGYGMEIMRDRLEKINGTLNIDSRVGRGTTLVFEVKQ